MSEKGIVIPTWAIPLVVSLFVGAISYARYLREVPEEGFALVRLALDAFQDVSVGSLFIRRGYTYIRTTDRKPPETCVKLVNSIDHTGGGFRDFRNRKVAMEFP